MLASLSRREESGVGEGADVTAAAADGEGAGCGSDWCGFVFFLEDGGCEEPLVDEDDAAAGGCGQGTLRS